jgi:AcrR family transcriptional regulator
MVVRRTRQMREQGEIHPTRDLIVDAAATLMKEKGVAGLHIDDVLERTGLSRGALYHHFTNVDDLIEYALLQTYAEGVNANIEYVRNVLASASTLDEFRRGVFDANLMYVRNEQLRALRKLRAHAMAATATASHLTTELAREQQRLTDEYIAVISQAQKNGWVRETVNPSALATFIQAYSFGVIVDDVSESHVDVDQWEAIIEQFFDSCVFTNK